MTMSTPRSMRLLGLTIAFLLLPSAAFAALPVEGYAGYAPQNTCSPNAKPGTTKLATWLQKTYPGTGSMGISRSCRDGGVSEHKEGRAFDWAADVNSARDRAAVADFLARAFATDAEGNQHALARRMGIMYLIWNDRIYSSYHGFKARPYAPCAVVTNCSATARHRNHVHLSLSRAGGNGTTSWYTGSAVVPPPVVTPPPPAPVTPPPPPPAPVTPPAPVDPPVVTSGVPTTPPAPRIRLRAGGVLNVQRTPYAAVSVPATGAATATSFKLRRGVTYKITAAGLYGYGGPAEVADASCTWTGAGWSATPAAEVARARGSLDLLVNGAPVATACRGSHVYTKLVTPKRTGRLTLRVANTAAGTTGSLTVLVSRRYANVQRGLPTYPAAAPAPVLTAARSAVVLRTETVVVPATSTGVLTAGNVVQGARYRIAVTGTTGLGGGVRSDGRCVTLSSAAGATWHPQASLDPRTPGAAHGRLYIDGVPFAGSPVRGSDVCAVRDHVAELTASRTGRMRLAVWDPYTRADDSGRLRVTVTRLTARG